MNNGKICTKCGIFKNLIEFGARKTAKDNRKSACKNCIRLDGRTDYINNFEKHKLRKQLSYQNNKTTILQKCKQKWIKQKNEISEKRKLDRQINPKKYAQYSKTYRKKNPKYYAQYMIKRKSTDILFRLKCNLRCRTNSLFKHKRWNKNNKLVSYIGCEIKELKNYLQSKFTKDMTWDNYGDWHIDHIVPLSSAKTEEEVYKLFHYTNLQPLWAIDNLKKGFKIKKP